MSTISEKCLQNYDMTSCSICLETFKEPKVLPCIHTFCLQCLDTYCKDKDPDEEATCPLCRKVFKIHSDGNKKLPNTAFIQQLIEVNKSTDVGGRQASNRTILCELCSDAEIEITATSFCIECYQHICYRCSVLHKKSKVSRSHQIVCGADIPSSADHL